MRKQRKFRKCSKHCEHQVYAKGLCKYHYLSELNKKTRQKKKKRTPIRKLSETEAARRYRYNRVRKQWFSDPSNQVCRAQVEGVCMFNATDVHHKAGRIGELLTNTSWWMPVCRACHRYIHDHSEWAEEKEFIVHLN